MERLTCTAVKAQIRKRRKLQTVAVAEKLHLVLELAERSSIVTKINRLVGCL